MFSNERFCDDEQVGEEEEISIFDCVRVDNLKNRGVEEEFARGESRGDDVLEDAAKS